MTDLWLPPGARTGAPKHGRERPAREPVKPAPGASPDEVLYVLLEGLQARRTPECLKANSGRHRYAGHPRETATCVHCGARRPEYRTCRFCAGFEPLVCLFCGGHRLNAAPEDVKAFMTELEGHVRRLLNIKAVEVKRSGKRVVGTARGLRHQAVRS